MNYGDALKNRLRLKRIYRRGVHEARKVAAPLIARWSPLREETFTARGQKHSYLVHPYNMTWRNERAVEVPMAMAFVRQATGVGMEFGNVLAHYHRMPEISTVIDKYEVGQGILNVDILDFTPSQPFDFIVSVSTIEHVGLDEPVKEPLKVLRTVDHLRGMLSNTGTMFITVPLGHNPVLDEAVIAGIWPTIWQTTLVRDGGRWIEGVLEVKPYDSTRGARSVWMAELAGL